MKRLLVLAALALTGCASQTYYRPYGDRLDPRDTIQRHCDMIYDCETYRVRGAL